MKIILEQAFHGLARRKLLSALIIAMMVVGLFLIIGVMGYAEHNEERVDDFYSAYPEDEYRFFVRGPVNLEGNPFDFTNEQIEELRNYFRAINNAPEFGFLHFSNMGNNGLHLYDVKAGDNCLDEYRDFNAARDYLYIESNGKFLSRAQAYSIDGRVFDRFKLKVAVGTDFSDFDHSDYDVEVIPIVCGWAWHEFYKVGDILHGAEYIARDYAQDYQIVGFLEPGLSILPPDAKDLEIIVSLDTYVLVPFLDCTGMEIPQDADPNSPEYSSLTLSEKRARSAHILQLEFNCEGVVFTKEVPNPIEKYLRQTGFSTFASTPRRVMMISDTFRQSADDYFDLLLLASVLILASSTLCLSLNLANKLMASFKTYAVHLISGGTVAHIKWFMAFEVFVILLISNIGAFLCALLFGGGVFTYNQMGIFGVQVSRISPFAAACAIGVSAVVSLIALAFPLIKISVVEYDMLLRGKE